jgi:hypothetical protein
MKREIIKLFGLFVFLIGVIFSLNSTLSFTGAFIGSAPITHSLSFFLGIAFLILGIIIFSTASAYHTTPSLEQRIISNQIAVSSSIKQHPSLLRLTENAIKDEAVEREMNHLIKELSKGNFEAGLGHPGHVEGTKIHYLRGRNGARLYFQEKGKNNYQIVAKSAKGRNQEQVINKIKEIY